MDFRFFTKYEKLKMILNLWILKYSYFKYIEFGFLKYINISRYWICILKIIFSFQGFRPIQVLQSTYLQLYKRVPPGDFNAFPGQEIWIKRSFSTEYTNCRTRSCVRAYPPTRQRQYCRTNWLRWYSDRVDARVSRKTTRVLIIVDRFVKSVG